VNATALRAFRVVVVESQAIIAKALCHLLDGDRELDVVFDARTAAEAKIGTYQPDLLIIDIDGCDAEFEETIEAARCAAPSGRIVVLTSHAGQQTMQRCLASRVDGYIVKDISPGELIRACKTVARGETYFDPRVAGGLLRRLQNDRPAEDELSLRETEILRLIATGLSNKEIGDRLCLSEKTVKNPRQPHLLEAAGNGAHASCDLRDPQRHRVTREGDASASVPEASLLTVWLLGDSPSAL
jgi:DNA-binding NarL/FixJ family response regulator